jgi:hypothetical protein
LFWQKVICLLGSTTSSDFPYVIFHTIYIVGGVGLLQVEWDKVTRSKDADIGMNHF